MTQCCMLERCGSNGAVTASDGSDGAASTRQLETDEARASSDCSRVLRRGHNPAPRAKNTQGTKRKTLKVTHTQTHTHTTIVRTLN